MEQYHNKSLLYTIKSAVKDIDMFFNNWKLPWLYDWSKTDNDTFYVIDSNGRNYHGMCSLLFYD